VRAPRTWADPTSGYASGPVGHRGSDPIVRADQATPAGIMPAVQDFLSHADPRMTSKYAHMSGGLGSSPVLG
jgi:hypothetical protein